MGTSSAKIQEAIQRLFEQSTGAVIRAVSGSAGMRWNVSVIVGELWIMMDQTLTYNTTPRIHK